MRAERLSFLRMVLIQPTCTTYVATNCEYNGAQDAIVRCVSEGMGEMLFRPLAVDGFMAEASSEGLGGEIAAPRETLIRYVSC